MHRSLTSVLAGALTLPLVVLSASVAQAESRPKPKTVAVTLKTDAMPTRVQVTSQAGRVTCVKVAAGPGRERRIWLTLDGQRTEKLSTRLAARRTTRCLLAGASVPRGSTLSIRVEEDLPGPFNPSARGSLTL